MNNGCVFLISLCFGNWHVLAKRANFAARNYLVGQYNAPFAPAGYFAAEIGK